ncbi:serine hydrolase domain-containing protein [Brachybacterium hainanense]|uniref:Serine hydrolase domain-containing protein n=1 Tax=Brachybacterium hainanense TaxID=1541174 RepID=A0ABV6R7B4_9MICO
MPRSSVPAASLPDARPDEEVLAEVGTLFETAVADHRTSGVSWAIIGGHTHREAVLAHGAAGAAHLEAGAPAPGSAPMARDSISRIASMTKSFTAAVVLALRDEGRLRLDDEVAQHVPEAAGLLRGTQDPLLADAPALTIRHLLTMSAGMVTDNPWGDRQEAMTREDFAHLLADGLGFVHRPGTGFEYSNTSYALLGRVIDELEDAPYQQVIRERFLTPLGMAATAFDRAELPADRIATGHRLADRDDATRFEAEPFDSPGVYGAMAGLFSSVDDVAAWVRFLAAADAPATAPAVGDGPMLAAASRREMQQAHRLQTTPPLPAGPDGISPGFDRVRAYGMGLVVERFADLGEIISHSGGYPGFGSFMAWHRPSGVGIVALANSKYAPAVPLSMQALRILAAEAPALFASPALQADARTVQAGAAMLAWLTTEDDAHADAWFADTMDPDQGREERLRRRDAALAAAGLGIGDLAGLDGTQASVVSRAHLRWTLAAGEHAADGVTGLRIDLEMDPRRAALVQALTCTPVRG